MKVIEKFEQIMKNIGWLKKELLLEQEILFWNTLKNIEEKLKEIHKSKISAQIRQDISLLKNTI